jgi:hypothetical protein
MKTYFDHEKLDVYCQAVDFCGWVGDFLNTITPRAAAKDQLDRASTSVPLNIAEGNGKFSAANRSRFFEIARGSAVKGLLRRFSDRASGLQEEAGKYGDDYDYEHEHESDKQA